MKEPAIGIIELNSLALGSVVSDAMAKRAPVKILESHPICPGKFLIIVVERAIMIAKIILPAFVFGALTGSVAMKNAPNRNPPPKTAVRGP